MPIHETVAAGGVQHGKLERVNKFEVGDVILWTDPTTYEMGPWTITLIDKHGQDVDLELLSSDMVTTDAATIDFHQPLVRIVPAHAVEAALTSLTVLEARDVVSTFAVAGSVTAVGDLSADATAGPP